MDNKKRVAVIGATGQIGSPLTGGLLKEGHDVKVLTRGHSRNNESKLARFETLGANVVVCADMHDVDSVMSITSSASWPPSRMKRLAHPICSRIMSANVPKKP